MKNLALYILIILFLTCGCSKSNLNSDETFSQPNNKEITNQQRSLNKEESNPKKKDKKKSLKKIYTQLTKLKGIVSQKI